MILLSHPTGNQFVRNALLAFEEEKILYKFYTGYAGFPSGICHTFLKLLIKDFKRREYSNLYKPYTISNPFDELIRLFSIRYPVFNKISSMEKKFSIDEIFKKHDLFVKDCLEELITRPQLIYGYEDCSGQTFKKAMEFGINCVYDLPIGYWKEARYWQEKACERYPYLRSTMRALNESDEKLYNKEQELKLATRIIVASTFTRNTLRNTPFFNKVKVVPYGFPEPVLNIHKVKSSKLRMLFVGGLTQRKGIGEVLEVAKKFEKYVDLTIVGRFTSQGNHQLVREIKNHKWIPSLSHDQILLEMDQNDVLIFPSWFEGFGLVISEAMSRGIPVISTFNTAGADFIKHAENGWIVNPGDIEAMMKIIEDLILNQNMASEIGEEAQLTASLYSWADYRKNLVKSVF